MTQTDTTTSMTTRAPDRRPIGSYLGRMALDVLGRRGAQMGVTWITITALAAVFAPFLANSHPYLIKMGGRWSSPLLRHLGATDVILLVAALSAMTLILLKRYTLEKKLAITFWMAAVVAPVVILPSLLQDLNQWRMDQTGGIYALIVTGLIFAGLLDLLVVIVLAVQTELSNRARIIILSIAITLVMLLLIFPVNSPRTTPLDEYRRAQAENRVQFVLNAPIPYSPTDRLRDQPFNADDPHPWNPRWSSLHLMGTERNGADILSRMIHASRIALAVGFISTGIAVVIGVTVGGLMGYFSGTVDLLGMRAVEIISAIPTFFLLLSLVAFWGRNLYLMMVIIGLTSWVGDALFTRAEFLRLRKQDFVQAAIACGLPLRSILFRHMLPNGIAPVLVSSSFGVASAILAESSLSFLGLGLIDEPSWGQMLSQATGAGGAFYWWIALFPGLAIFLTVFAYNLIGEALRDAIDPHAQRASML